MCVAIGQRKNAATITEEELRRGWGANPDGGGYAFIDTKTGKILIRKFMSKEPFIKAYLRDHKAHGVNSPFLVHMRIATHGKVMEDTAHPFRIDSEFGEMVFAHNGIIDEVQEYTNDTTSDTMAFRDLFLDELPDSWLDSPAMNELVESYIGWSKLVFLTTSEACADQLYIINESAGYWIKDNWFSNHSCAAKLSSWDTPQKEYNDYDNWFVDNKYAAKDWVWDDKEDQAMSFVVRENMNSILLSANVDVVIEEAEKQGYCKYCLFKPCKCEDTCYTCNNRGDHCTCKSGLLSIGDMRGYVSDSFFMECRENDLIAEWEALDAVPSYTPRSVLAVTEKDEND